MDKKYQTRASKAEEQVLGMLRSERNIQRPWSLVSLPMRSRTLQTTAAEASVIFNSETIVRPGYEQSDQAVYIPNLFLKISGSVEEFSCLGNKESLHSKSNCFIFDSFADFPAAADRSELYKPFLVNGQIDKSALFSSDSFSYTFLRKEYQEVFIEKVNQILQSKQEYLIGTGTALSDIEVASCLLQTDERFLQSFNNFDYQYMPPSIIISNKGQETPNPHQCVTLLLLNKLGFDIIIESSKGYSDIENILNPECYCLFTGGAKSGGKPVTRSFRMVTATLAAVILVVAAFFIIRGFVFSAKKTDPQVQDAGLKENAPITAVAQNTSIPSAKTFATNQPKLLNNDVIPFNDPALEKAIRTLLGKESGDISVDEVLQLYEIIIWGEKAFTAEERPVIACYQDSYTIDGIEYKERGQISDLSVFTRMPRIPGLNINYQENLYLDTLRGASIESLYLRGDNIKDITALKYIDRLNFLQMDYNSVRDLSPLVSQPLKYLLLSYNNIEDIKPLSELPGLLRLEIAGNTVKDLKTLENLKELRILDISRISIKDFGFLADLPYLESLSLCDTGLKDLSVIKDNTRLKSLDIARNSISDLSILKDFKSLETLYFDDTNVHDISVLKELPNLKTISLFGVTLDDETVLDELKDVKIFR